MDSGTYSVLIVDNDDQFVEEAGKPVAAYASCGSQLPWRKEGSCLLEYRAKGLFLRLELLLDSLAPSPGLLGARVHGLRLGLFRIVLVIAEQVP